MKYIIVETPEGLEVPIVFAETVEHLAMLPQGMLVRSAGFCRLYTQSEFDGMLVHAICYGTSASLGRPLRDKVLDDGVIVRGLNFTLQAGR